MDTHGSVNEHALTGVQHGDVERHGMAFHGLYDLQKSCSPLTNGNGSVCHTEYPGGGLFT
jgi:hypothetical protein